VQPTNVDVSVVIATYRREHLLLEAISSVTSQRGVDVEVLVVDDSPEGAAGDGVRALRDPRIRYVHRAEPSGGRPGAVRNDGVALARGPLVHFLDDDDRLVDGSLAALSAAIRETGVGMGFGRVVPFGDDPVIREQERAYFEKAADISRHIRGRHWFAAQLMFGSMPLINSACTVRRDVFVACGGYDPSLRCCEDVDLYLRIGRASGFTFVDRDVLHYRVGAPSIMTDLRRNPATADKTKLLEAYFKMQERYRRQHGAFEYRTLQVWARVASFLPSRTSAVPTTRAS
jgi:GT2 family glycosyltransferase